MEPTRNSHATLVDLLDRVLDKGLVIHADLIISLAGVPLIGVNLRTALAGMETMIKYGMMQDWDERTRAWESEHRKIKKASVTSGERVFLEMLGAYYYSGGIYTTWRMGRIYLTDKRLILYHPTFEEVLFEMQLENIKGLTLEREEHANGMKRENLCILLEAGTIARLHALDTLRLKEALEQRLLSLGLSWQEIPKLSLIDERAPSFLGNGEEVVCQGRMWHSMTCQAPAAPANQTWKAGQLYLTNRRLCWWYDFEGKIGFDISLEQIAASTLEEKAQGDTLSKKESLDVIYDSERGRRVASFSGDNLESWKITLNRTTLRIERAPTGDVETCPICEKESLITELSGELCRHCGWIAPKPKSQQRLPALQETPSCER